MTLRSRGWVGGLLVLGLALAGQECRASMTLQFNIEPLTKPEAGSLTREADDTLRATNLAVTSVTSVDNGSTLSLSKYMDFQSGPTGFEGVANFFLLNKVIEQAAGTTPNGYCVNTGAQTFMQKGDGSFLFTMRINYGYVEAAIVDHFGSAAEAGWTGLLTLNIARFDNSLAAGQVTSGTIVLTTSLLPVPAGEELNPGATVPEPASCVMAGLGLLMVAGVRTRVGRTRVGRTPR